VSEGQPGVPAPPGSGDPSDSGPRVGTDEWVARHGEKHGLRGGPLGTIERRWLALPWWVQWLAFAAVTALLPLVFESGYVRRVAFDTVLYILLAVGLNVVIGWGGLLDLGYIAFYGLGAYGYALLSSEQFGLHLSAIPVMVVGTVGLAIIGFLVGLPSWRLVGDYLAIVTLFFFQIFITVVTNGQDILGINFTNGSNGVVNLDPFDIFGWDIRVATEGVFNVAYLYIALVVLVLVVVALRFVNLSRTGRAWRSLREDPLAAELMGMPVNRLKLMAFAFGAAVAGLTGSLFASLNAGVFPQTFQFPLLITVYTMVILGGSGSMAGVVIGAVIVNVLLEVLREPSDSRYIFYAVIVLGLVAALRPWPRLAAVLGGTIAFGFAAHAIASGISDSAVGGTVDGGGWLGEALASWVIVPDSLGAWAQVTYVGLVAAALLLTQVRGVVRLALLVPVLYLAAFVWENVMAGKPEPTRFIVLGLILITTMIVRPAGILGEKRVEIV
jgi:branched-chain amino acid transport system permease protein